MRLIGFVLALAVSFVVGVLAAESQPAIKFPRIGYLAADPQAPLPAYSLGPPDAAPLIGIEVARYRSLAAFQADRTIDQAYRWVLYDPERWDDTPAEEQADPWTWLPRFGQYAHARGYRVIAAPARDLGDVAGTAMPRHIGEDITAWYTRTGLAGVAARHADIVSIQSQALAEYPTAYEAFVNYGIAQAKYANPYVKVFAGLSTKYGTAAQMAAAARSVKVDGYWLNVPGPAPDIAKAVEFLRLMTGGQ